MGLRGEFFQQEESQKLLIELTHDHAEEVMQHVGAIILDDKSGTQCFIRHYTGLFDTLPLTVVSGWLQNVGVTGAQKLARHLPIPYINSSGEAVVPQLTEHVLEKFENDERTFAEFCAGMYSSGGFVSNLATQLEAEAEAVKQFLTHRLRRIREWAVRRIESSKRHADHWRQVHEEQDLD